MTRAHQQLFRGAAATAAFIPALALAHTGHGAGLHTHGEGWLIVGVMLTSFGLIAAGAAAIRRARR